MLGNFEKSQNTKILENICTMSSLSSYFQGKWLSRKANDISKQPLKANSSLVFPALKVLQNTLGY